MMGVKAVNDNNTTNDNSFNSLLNSLQNSSSKSGGSSDSYGQIMSYVQGIGNNVTAIINAKSQAESQIAQIKLAAASNPNNVAAQQYYQSQIDNMNTLITLLVQKMNTAKKSSNTGLYIAIGVGAVAVLGLVAVLVLKK